MRILLLIGISIAMALSIFKIGYRIKDEERSRLLLELKERKSKSTIRCGVDWSALKNWLEEVDIPPMPGAGIYKWKISTKSDSAQFYFDQGINMYYGFHIIEAQASFKKAARFDPKSAMIFWAQALAYGPNINDYGYLASPEAWSACNTAIGLSGTATDKEKYLITVQKTRYTDDSTQTREKLNQTYADMMKQLYNKFPDDMDIAVLYADAMMLQHPWDLWNIDGTPKGWTPAIREVLEKVLAKAPNHPGANHYYIHVMEASPEAAKALPSAGRLGKTNPGLSHLVHMPSHIYLRTGNYQLGFDVNVNAVTSYEKSIVDFAPASAADFLYKIHNLHMKTNQSMLAGWKDESIKAAAATSASVPDAYLETPAPMGNALQYISMTPMFVKVRFGLWDELIRMEKPKANYIYGNVLYHFGRGMGYANKEKFEEAKNEFAELVNLMKDSSLAIPMSPFSPAKDGAIVAANLLGGTIALKEKKYPQAIALFEKAAAAEANMVYNEPRDWILNPKHYLGNAYLVSGDGVNAERVFRDDLKVNSDNGWALLGLAQAQTLQNKKADSEKTLAKAKAAFAKSDVKIEKPVY